jgi:pimeloyl-ACP methyl ester carboxylesterase
MTRPNLTPHRFRDTDAERGTLAVPVYHADPGGNRIELRFVRLRARRDASRPPVVFLTGGPGLSGIRSGEGRLFPMFDAMRDDRDVILLDQRARVADEMVPRERAPQWSAQHATTRDGYLDAIGHTVRNTIMLLESRGIPAGALHTNESADDVAVLVRALYGDNARTALLGWSYGSHLAMAVIRRHNTLVETAVLAAPEGPDQTLKRPVRIEEHIARLSSRAAIDLRGAMARALERIAREQPVVETHRLGRFDLEWAFSEGIADTRLMRKLPGLLARLERGDYAVLSEDVLLRGAWRSLRDELPFGAARYCFDCASGATASRRALIEQETRETLLGNTIDFPLPDICDAVGCPDLGDAFRAPLRANTPVLFVTGTLDCRTPVENLDELVAGLPDHRHLAVEDAGHADLLLPSHVQSAIVRFLHAGQIDGTVVGTDEPLTFV